MPNFRIEVKIPDLKKFGSEEFIKRIEDAQRTKTGPALKRLFEQTTEGWQHKPTFGEYHFRTSHSISVQVRTVSGIMENAALYALVSKGSPPHTILPKNATWLYFQTGYRAGTRPGSLSSQRYQRFGKFVQAGGVHHPGFEAREFDKTVGETHKPDFERDMAEAMKP